MANDIPKHPQNYTIHENTLKHIKHIQEFIVTFWHKQLDFLPSGACFQSKSVILGRNLDQIWAQTCPFLVLTSAKKSSERAPELFFGPRARILRFSSVFYQNLNLKKIEKIEKYTIYIIIYYYILSILGPNRVSPYLGLRQGGAKGEGFN